MNKELRRVSIVVLIMFLALFGSTTIIQVFQQDNLKSDGRNVRTLYASFSAERGSILVAGQPIATSVATDDEYKYQRQYANGALYSAVTGYFTLNQGNTGLESSLNDYLSGTANEQFLAQLNAILTGQNPKGASVETTIDPVVQQAAWDALGNYQGAVVALNPKTGAILAMVSKPTFDPNTLAVHDSAQVISTYKQLLADSGDPLINRAISGSLNPPGSTFKLVVSSAALESGNYTPDSPFPNPPSLQLPQSSTVITNAEGGSCGGGDTATIATALRLSCNIPFAQLGLALGYNTISEQAKKYGFGDDTLRIPMKVTPSVYPADGQRRPADDLVVRTGQRPGDPAPDGHGLGGDRQRRQADDPESRRQHHGTGSLGAAEADAHPLQHPDQHRHGDHDDAVDGQQRRQRCGE